MHSIDIIYQYIGERIHALRGNVLPLMKAKVRLPQCPFTMFCLSAEYDFATTSVDMIYGIYFRPSFCQGSGNLNWQYCSCVIEFFVMSRS